MVNTTCQVKSCGLSEPFEVECGLRQGDPIAPLLFYIALQAIINRAGISQEGTIFTKMTQVLPYADDVVINGRSLQSIKTAFKAMDVEAKRMGGILMRKKPRLCCWVRSLWTRGMGLEMVPYNLQVVRSFTYLGSIINENQDEEEEVKSSIAAGNRAYFFIVRLIKSRLVSRTTKFTLYKML
ncbi:uncharacterized protein [Halyomorpha halys]|uniref:uncharacterized protein n=1 Tax=Halyomorpha halys TaxID=286706 RepID=UPI0034D23B75